MRHLITGQTRMWPLCIKLYSSIQWSGLGPYIFLMCNYFFISSYSWVICRSQTPHATTRSRPITVASRNVLIFFKSYVTHITPPPPQIFKSIIFIIFYLHMRKNTNRQVSHAPHLNSLDHCFQNFSHNGTLPIFLFECLLICLNKR